MKKSLLSLAMLASVGFAANAASETFEVKDATNIKGTYVETTYDKDDATKVSVYAHYQPLQSLELGSFSFSFEENGASTKPAYYTSKTDECTIRVYAKSSMTISNDADFNMQSITFNLTKYQGLDANNMITSSAGGSFIISADGKTLIWNAPETEVIQESVTFTIPSTKGADSKSPNIQFSSVVISTEAADPGEDPGPVTPPATDDHIYAGLLATATTCDWTFTNVTLPEGMEEIWSWKSFSNAYYLNGSAYDSKEEKALASEAYAVSPVIDLTNAKTATATWEQACKFQTTIKDLCKFCVREEGATEWTVMEIPAWPEKNDKWTWASAGTVDLKDYVGKKIEVAFKYASSEEGADTWEIRNFYIDGETEGGITPPVDDKHAYSGLLATSTTCDWTFANVTLPEGIDAIWNWKNFEGAYYLNGSAYDSKEKKALVGEAYAISPVIDLTEYEDATATWEQACKFQTTIKDLCKFCVREEGAADWTVLEIPAWPELDNKWTWASAGTVDLKEYAGKKIEVAFKYASSEEGADTWEIRNFFIDGNKVGVEAIEAENVPARYYDLNGRAVSADRLDAGIYVEVRGTKARKVIIRK